MGEVEVDLEEVHREEHLGEEDQTKKESLRYLCFRSFISICTITMRVNEIPTISELKCASVTADLGKGFGTRELLGTDLFLFKRGRWIAMNENRVRKTTLCKTEQIRRQKRQGFEGGTEKRFY